MSDIEMMFYFQSFNWRIAVMLTLIATLAKTYSIFTLWVKGTIIRFCCKSIIIFLDWRLFGAEIYFLNVIIWFMNETSLGSGRYNIRHHLHYNNWSWSNLSQIDLKVGVHNEKWSRLIHIVSLWSQLLIYLAMF